MIDLQEIDNITWATFKRNYLTEEEKRQPIVVQRFLITKRFFDLKGGESYLLDLIDNIKNWNYENYIRHDPIWATIRNFAVYVAPYCANCGSNQSIEVHHLSYRSLGIELYHLEDIIVYCGMCHCIYTILYRANKKSYHPPKSIQECSPGAEMFNILELIKTTKGRLYEMVQA